MQLSVEIIRIGGLGRDKPRRGLPARTAKGPVFAPAGQSTQLIVGASPEPDRQIVRLAEALYGRFGLKGVFHKGYVPVSRDNRLPALSAPPLLREHRLYQADWLLRHYGFRSAELFDDQHEWLDEQLDPKATWALRHSDLFPVEVNMIWMPAFAGMTSLRERAISVIPAQAGIQGQRQFGGLPGPFEQFRFRISGGDTFMPWPFRPCSAASCPGGIGSIWWSGRPEHSD
jgi:hypothetical protein